VKPVSLWLGLVWSSMIYLAAHVIMRLTMDSSIKETLRGMWRNWNPCALLVGIQDAMENSIVPQRIKNRITI
jgi:hypothetical protein